MMELILKYFDGLNAKQLSQLDALQPLYNSWNERINVISRKDILHLYERHILHSLAIAKIIQFKPGTRILDVGTGGGFPGIPLAILFPEVQFDLIDSIGKKIKVVQEISKSIGLHNIASKHQRVQEVKNSYDFIVSRAVTQLPDFTEIVKGKIQARSINELQNGILYLKGGVFDEELAMIKNDYRIYHLSEFFNENFFESKKLVHIYS